MATEQIKFNDENIQKIFGHEAAEDEDPARLRQYYFKNNVFEQVTADLSLRVLVGHKGIGKSALFSVAMAEDNERDYLSISIQPNDIADLGNTEGSFLDLVRHWEKGLNEIITQKVFYSFGISHTGLLSELKNFSGKTIDFFIETFQGAKIGNIDIANLSPTRKKIRERFLQYHKVNVYIDDLDRGWEGRKEDIKRISALLNAVRDISNDNRGINKGINFKISLRSDVYFAVRTSDESTDKIEGSVVWYSWTNHEIFVLLIKRLETYRGIDIDEETLLKTPPRALANYLYPIMEEKYSGSGLWENAPMYRVLMSLIRKRPRDLVKLCTLAAKKAYQDKANRIRTEHFRSIFEEYSRGRVQDTINEYRSELPEIRRLVMGMRPSSREKTTKAEYVYDTNSLLKKIQSVIGQGPLRFSNGKIADPRELAAFLYKINFLTARKELEDGSIVRRYFEEQQYLFPVLSNDTSFGFSWEIHPAYRWALQPDTIDSIFNSLHLSADDL